MASENATEPSQVTNWQPIETAPKDGTLILLGGGAQDNEPYDLNFKWPVVTARWYSDDWLVALAEAGCVMVTYERPTRWMPIPELAGE